MKTIKGLLFEYGGIGFALGLTLGLLVFMCGCGSTNKGMCQKYCEMKIYHNDDISIFQYQEIYKNWVPI